MFTLFEELSMLATHESKGIVIKTTVERLKTGLAGAILAELALSGKIQTTFNHRLQVVDDSQTDVEMLNEALGLLKESKKERKFGYWVDALDRRMEKKWQRITETLIGKGALAREDEDLVWVVPAPLQTDTRASTKYLINKQLRGIVLAQEDFQVRELALLSLVRACRLLELVFLRDERKTADRFIHEQLTRQAISDPVIQTVQEIIAAVDVAVEED